MCSNGASLNAGQRNINTVVFREISQHDIEAATELRARVREFVQVTGQDLVVTSEGDLLVRVVQRPNQVPKVSVRWWRVARQLFGLSK